MGVHFRDYYEILGVPRNANSSAIKKAFKKLARKYHPDIAKDKIAAEEKFKEINEAYEVLSDPAKRSKYDLLGENWQHGSDFTPPPGSENYNYHFGGSTGFSDFFENFFSGRTNPSSQRQRTRSAKGQDFESDLLVTLDEIIHGGERTIRLQTGSSGAIKTVKIKIPVGVSENQLIRCAGLGNPGAGGAPAGDLLFADQIRTASRFSF